MLFQLYSKELLFRGQGRIPLRRGPAPFPSPPRQPGEEAKWRLLASPLPSANHAARRIPICPATCLVQREGPSFARTSCARSPHTRATLYSARQAAISASAHGSLPKRPPLFARPSSSRLPNICSTLALPSPPYPDPPRALTASLSGTRGRSRSSQLPAPWPKQRSACVGSVPIQAESSGSLQLDGEGVQMRSLKEGVQMRVLKGVQVRFLKGVQVRFLKEAKQMDKTRDPPKEVQGKARVLIFGVRV